MNLPHLPCPVSDSVNPGCSSPADQCFAPAPLGMADPSSFTGGPVAQSSGEGQYPAASGAGVTVTPGSVPLVQLCGDVGSRVDVCPAAVAQVTGRGLAANVMADGQGSTRSVPPTIARCTPVAVDVSAGSSRPGKLAANVMVR